MARDPESLHRIVVCQGCTHGVPKREREGTRGGQRLIDSLRAELERREIDAFFDVQPASCLGSCDRSCTVSFDAPGKHTFVLAGLSGPEAAPDLAAFAERYATLPDGKVRKSDRPESLRRSVAARIPPRDR